MLSMFHYRNRKYLLVHTHKRLQQDPEFSPVLLRKDMGLGEAKGTAAQGRAHRAGGMSDSLGDVPAPPLM